MSYFKPFEVVGRGSETQFQVAENILNVLRVVKICYVILSCNVLLCLLFIFCFAYMWVSSGFLLFNVF